VKNSKLMLSAVFAMFVVLTPAFAQTGAIRVSVPFAFTAGKRTMPAGDYRVTVNGSFLQLMNVDAKAVSNMMTNYTGGGPNENQAPRLVFHCYGSHRYLTEAWVGETVLGHELAKSSAERELARSTPADQNIILAAR
jgi:hypothetical protein